MKFTNRHQLENWVADHYGTKEDSEGSIEECLVAGWVNAMDTEEDRSINMNNEEFFRYALDPVNNMHPGAVIYIRGSRQ